ncbi:MAG: hypothetical protein ABH879_10660 [archaeon]
MKLSEHLRPGKRLFAVSGYEILFILCSLILCGAVLFSLMNLVLELVPLMNLAMDMQTNQLDALDSHAMDQLSQSRGIIRGFVVKSLATIGLAVIAFALILTVFQGLIFCRLREKRFSRKFFRGLFIANIIWIAAWSALKTMVVVLVPSLAAVFLLGFLLIVFSHLTLVLYSCFNEKEGAWANIRAAFGKCWRKTYLHRFLVVAGAGILLGFVSLAALNVPYGFIIGIIMYLWFSYSAKSYYC